EYGNFAFKQTNVPLATPTLVANQPSVQREVLRGASAPIQIKPGYTVDNTAQPSDPDTTVQVISSGTVPMNYFVEVEDNSDWTFNWNKSISKGPQYSYNTIYTGEYGYVAPPYTYGFIELCKLGTASYVKGKVVDDRNPPELVAGATVYLQRSGYPDNIV